MQTASGRPSPGRTTRSPQQPRKQSAQPSKTTQQASVPESMQLSVPGALSSASSAVGKAYDSAIKTIKDNPIPVTLAGIGVVCAGAGIAWFMMSGGKAVATAAGAGAAMGAATDTDSSSIKARGTAMAQRMKSSMQDATKSVKDTAQVAGTKMSELAHEAAIQGRRLEQSLEETVKEHPLAAGAALVAIGAAIGLAIPRTKLEDGWLGRERDQIVGAAQKAARGAVEKVESFAKNAVAQA